MKTPDMEPLLAVPSLLNAFRKGQDEFGMAVKRYSAEARVPASDAAGQECLELLDHLVNRLRDSRNLSREGMEDACIFLLEHLAARLQEHEFAKTRSGEKQLIQ